MRTGTGHGGGYNVSGVSRVTGTWLMDTHHKSFICLYESPLNVPVHCMHFHASATIAQAQASWARAMRATHSCIPRGARRQRFHLAVSMEWSPKHPTNESLARVM